MANDSSTGGYLVQQLTPFWQQNPPLGPLLALEGTVLEDFISALLVGLTGLDQTLVRPAWQPEPPNTPALGSDWVAHQIIDSDPDFNAVELHNDDGQGNMNDTFIRHEEITWRLSCIGPNAWKYAGLIRDGLQVEQNRAVLISVGMGLVECGRATPAPMLVKDRYRYRVDLSLTLKREIQRTVPIDSLASASGTLKSDVPNRTVPFQSP